MHILRLPCDYNNAWYSRSSALLFTHTWRTCVQMYKYFVLTFMKRSNLNRWSNANNQWQVWNVVKLIITTCHGSLSFKFLFLRRTKSYPNHVSHYMPLKEWCFAVMTLWSLTHHRAVVVTTPKVNQEMIHCLDCHSVLGIPHQLNRLYKMGYMIHRKLLKSWHLSQHRYI